MHRHAYPVSFSNEVPRLAHKVPAGRVLLGCLKEAHHWLHHNFLRKQVAIVILQSRQQMHICSCSKLDVAISVRSEFLLYLSGQTS